MNIVLLEVNQFVSESRANLNPRQVEHIREILKSKSGDILTVGQLDGMIGKGELVIEGSHYSLVNIRLTEAPPLPLACVLILALPRPQMVKRILQTTATYGVEKIILLQTNRVEKNYWQSPKVRDDEIQRQLILGLEQAKATQLPVIEKYPKFNNFISGPCQDFICRRKKIVVHPGEHPLFPSEIHQQPLAVVIGPEGGLTQTELEHLAQLGFEPQQLGRRILRVETAVNAVLARLI